MAEHFEQYQETLHGYLRYEIARCNLLDILPPDPPLRVADVGGGAGPDTFWLAEMGHDVTLVEPSEKQLVKAEKKLETVPDEVRNRITLVHGFAEDITPEQGAQGFDVVLSHCVAMYQTNPKAYVTSVIRLAKPGGKISLLEKGYYGSITRLITTGREDEIDEFEKTHLVVNGEGVEVRAFMPNELLELIKNAGAKTLKWYGVRVINDDYDKKATDLSMRELQTRASREQKLGRRPNIKEAGQLYQFLAQRREPPADIAA